MELNPDNKHLQATRDYWLKIVGILLNKLAPGQEVVITEADINALQNATPGEMPCVVSHEAKDGIHLRIVGEREGMKLAARHGREHN